MKLRLLILICLFALSACGPSGNSAISSNSSNEDLDAGGNMDIDPDADFEEYCPLGADYDEAEDLCYVDCDGLTDEECAFNEEIVFGEFDEYVLDNYSGADSEDSEESVVKAQYEIKDDLSLTTLEITEPDSDAKFKEIWVGANKVLPRAQMIDAFSQYHVDSDGPSNTLAYVRLDDNQPGKWIIGFDDADYKSATDKEFIHTSVHEFGHIVFLGKDQVDLGSTGSCPNYAIDEGCTKAESHINKYYQQFWTDIIDEHAALNTEEQQAAFYEKYKARFVSEYAMTNPVEDAAEIFTNFVLRDKPSAGDTPVNQKILMMHGIEALTSLRNDIRGKLTVTRERKRLSQK